MIALNEVSVLGALEWSGVFDGAVSGANVGASSCFMFSTRLTIRDALARVIHWTIVLLPLILFIQSASAKDIDDKFLDIVVAVADAHDLTNKEAILKIISKKTNLNFIFNEEYDKKNKNEKERFASNIDQDGMEVSYSSSGPRDAREASLILCYCGRITGDEQKIMDFMGKRFLDITYRDGLNLQIDKKYLLWSNDREELYATITGDMPFRKNAKMIILDQVQKSKSSI